MAEKPDHTAKLDEDRVAIPLDPVEALRALLKVDPDAEPASKATEPNRSAQLKRKQG